MTELPKKTNRPGVGEYGTFTRGGEFVIVDTKKAQKVKIEPGDRGVVVQASRIYNPKKIWVYVKVYNHNRKIVTIEAPWWWLKPRSILDDLAEI